jgi:hypothetical protein
MQKRTGIAERFPGAAEHRELIRIDHFEHGIASEASG